MAPIASLLRPFRVRDKARLFSCNCTKARIQRRDIVTRSNDTKVRSRTKATLGGIRGIILRPINPGYAPIVLDQKAESTVDVIAEVIELLGTLAPS